MLNLMTLVYMFDTETEEVSYLFDIIDYMEGIQIRGNYMTWLGSEGMYHGTRVYSLFDLKITYTIHVKTSMYVHQKKG